ncbi:MAG: transcriptional regulator TrmB [Actinobacteria bacterium]|nr:MAG: transcriptional regulator TrmB [Actinomycetota bacterium]
MLEAFDLDPLEEALYLALVDSPSCTVDELARLADTTGDQATGILDRLERAGLITRLPGVPDRYCAIEPSIGLAALVANQDQLVRRAEEQAQRARASAHQLAERFRLRGARYPLDLIEVVVGAETVRQRTFQVERTAQTELRAIDMPPYVIDMPPYAGAVNEPALELLGNGGGIRCLYDRVVLDLPGKLAEIERYRAAGEEGRILAGVPFKLLLADDRLAMIVLTEESRTVSSALVVGPSALLGGLSRMFETLWRLATPLHPTDPQPGADLPSEAESQLLALLAAGMTDKIIARRLGISIRTAQKRVQQLMGRLGVDTRFQAGLQARTRGWL